MSRVFARSEHLTDRIFEVKLPVTHWKVLFAVNGEMDTSKLSQFLDMSREEVENTLKKLEEIQLVTVVEEAAAAPTEAPEEATKEPEVEKSTTRDIEEAIQQEIIQKETEQIETGAEGTDLEFPEGEQEIEESYREEAEEGGRGAEKEESTQILGETVSEPSKEGGGESRSEEAETPQEQGAASSDEDFDKLIGDLLQEEEREEDTLGGISFEEEPREETPTDFEPAEKTEPGEKEPTQPAPEETSAEPEQKEKAAGESEDLDFGSIFQEDLAETEQTLSDLMGALEEEISREEVEGAVEAPPEGEELPKPSKTILVVDDSVVIRKMVEIALENENYDIVSVATGKEALQFIDEKEPNLVILDIMLPDVNGLDILKAIKASKSIPVVMLSAKDTPRETSKAKELGADDFIPKPFKDEELVVKVKELIRE